MNILYNNIDKISNDLTNFLKKTDNTLSKPKLKVLPSVLTAIIRAENITTLDISKYYNDSSNLTNNESIQKKIWRFLNNNNFNGRLLLKKYIKKIINNVSNLKHNKIIVCFDHMYVKNNFVTLMFSLKVDSSSIPIWFKCDKTKSNRHYEIDEENKQYLFSEKVIFNAIDDVINLLSPLNNKIIFLADRWFCNINLMKHIDQMGHYFCIRAKVNSSIKFLIYDKREKHKVYKHFSDLPIHKHSSIYYNDLYFPNFNFKCNLSISRGKLSDDPWFILSNLSPDKALREYSHRFGGIEMLFKSQKTNGFNLEKTKTRNLHAFQNLYSLVCFAYTWLTIIGIDYIKNYKRNKEKINIRFLKRNKNGKPIRTLSSFNLGLTIFIRVFMSHINYPIKCNMKLYL